MANVFRDYVLEYIDFRAFFFDICILFSDPTSKQYGHFKAGAAHKDRKVRLIRLSRFVNQIVATRKIPNLNKDRHGVPKYVTFISYMIVDTYELNYEALF